MRNSIRCQDIGILSVLQYNRQFYIVSSSQFLSRQAAANQIESAFSWDQVFLLSPRPKRPQTTTLRLRVHLAVNTAHKQLQPDLIPDNTQRPLRRHPAIDPKPPKRYSVAILDLAFLHHPLHLTDILIAAPPLNKPGCAKSRQRNRCTSTPDTRT